MYLIAFVPAILSVHPSVRDYINFCVSAISSVSVDGFSPTFCHWCTLEQRWTGWLLGSKGKRSKVKVTLSLGGFQHSTLPSSSGFQFLISFPSILGVTLFPFGLAMSTLSNAEGPVVLDYWFQRTLSHTGREENLSDQQTQSSSVLLVFTVWMIWEAVYLGSTLLLLIYGHAPCLLRHKPCTSRCTCINPYRLMLLQVLCVRRRMVVRRIRVRTVAAVRHWMMEHSVVSVWKDSMDPRVRLTQMNAGLIATSVSTEPLASILTEATGLSLCCCARLLSAAKDLFPAPPCPRSVLTSEVMILSLPFVYRN